MVTLAPSARFASTRRWTIDCNDYGERFYELYHIVSATRKSVLLQSTLHFESTLDVDKANVQLDALCKAHADGIYLLNECTAPVRFILKHDAERGVFFNVGKGTACRRIYVNQATPVRDAIAKSAAPKRKRTPPV